MEINELVVEVTQEDIDHGVIGDADMCPIALAVKRVAPGNVHEVIVFDQVFITYRNNCGTEGTEQFKASTPVDAFRFVVDFDEARPVSPFTFTLKGFQKSVR